MLQLAVSGQTQNTLNIIPQNATNNIKPQPLTLNTQPQSPKTLTLGVKPPQSLTLGVKPPQSLTLGVTRPGQRQQAQPIQPGAKVIDIKPGVIYPTASDYKQYDQRTHVYMKPDMYIGADEPVVREEWLYDAANRRMVYTTISFVPGCAQIFSEILTNASDHVGASRRAGLDPGPIEIMMDNETVSITNYGLPMPVQIHPDEKVWVPQMNFGSLLSGSHYEVDRHEAGTNGIGAKAANIFSMEFMVVVCDHVRHLKYTQVWNKNMIYCGTPNIEPYNEKISSLQVVYKMDFARFGYPVPNGTQGGYIPEAFALFARHAIDISFAVKTRVTFNGLEFNYGNIREYARLYFGDVVNSAIVYYQWPPGTEITTKNKGYQVAKNPSITPLIELIAVDTPDNGRHVSFVNYMMTRDGGVHVNAAMKAVGDGAVKTINETVIKQLTKHNKGKELDAKDKRSHTININDVKPHISILLSVKVINPKFTSQTKTTLHSPTPKINISEEELRAIQRWQLMDRLYAAIDAKQFASLKQTDGKRKRNIVLPKGIDANLAGSDQSHQCALYCAEGKSGAGYIEKLMALIPGSRDFIGTLPMRGKLFNVMDKKLFQIEKNKEIKELKDMLGLCEGMDYTDPVNFGTLRYGNLVIMADSDVDGKHIIGLIINFFHCRFPSLLARGYVMYYRTPTIRVTLGRSTLKFYFPHQYDEWKEETPNYKKWTHKYFKGLGTSNDSNVKDDYATPRVVTCFYDVDAPNAMRLAFDKKCADQRKDWIGRWQHVMGVDDVQIQPISWFINYEMILFSIADVQRSIPKLTDGLKEAQRKIIHAAHSRWKIGSKKLYGESRVSQFASYAAEKSNYHHGDVILGEVIVGMTQYFTGSNNISFFYPEGQFGSKYEGGKNAAATRYTHTFPENLFQYIFRKEDRPILRHMIDEGENIEPETYYPVIPTILVNGARGIGSGWSTTIPNHNPLDIIKCIRMLLQGIEVKDLPELLPWFCGFSGTIKVIDRRHRKKKATDKVNVTIINNTAADGTVSPQVYSVETEDEDYDDEGLNEDENDEIAEVLGSRPLLSMITYGKFHTDFSGTIFVTELPVGRWPVSYHKWLEGLAAENKITGFRDLSIDNTVYFEIYGFPDVPNHRNLKLKRTTGMSNMVLLDENNRPVRYDTAIDILEAFYVRRLPVYQFRKDYILGNLTAEIEALRHKIRFIHAVISKQVRIINRTKASIYESLDQLDIPREIYIKSMNHHLSEDDITNLREQIIAKELEHSILENTTTSQMWMNDLAELEEAYRNRYGFERQGLSLTLGPQPKNSFPKSSPTAPTQARQPAKGIMLDLVPISSVGRNPLRLNVAVPIPAVDVTASEPINRSMNLNIMPLGLKPIA